MSLVEPVRSTVLPPSPRPLLSLLPRDSPPGGPPRLSPAALAVLVEEIAADTALWRPLVVHHPERRLKIRLLASDVYEVWLLGWSPSHRVELHDHGGSHAALQVVDGVLREIERTASGLVGRTLVSGARRRLPSGTVHEVLNVSPTVATSIHAYSPPLSTMAFYDASGAEPVRRSTVLSEPPLLRVGPTERHRRLDGWSTGW